MRLRLYVLSVFTLLISATGFSQDLTIISPEGLFEPYEVAPGTAVTFQWDYFGEAPVIFTHTEEPELPPFGTDPAWTQSSNAVDNGDGTYNFEVTINEPLWVWAGYYQEFFGSYSYSPIYAFSIASGVVISGEDGIICPDGTGEEILSVEGEYDSYQWIKDGEPIAGATESTYIATEAGIYRLDVVADGETLPSNLVQLVNAEISMTGIYTQGETELTMAATGGFDTYQWLSGPSADNLSNMDGETESDLTVQLTSETVFYAVEGTVDGCTVTTEARSASADLFETPILTLSADSNSYGNVCEGSTIEIMVNDIYGSYGWLQNGFSAWGDQPVFMISQSYQAGDYAVVVSPIGWPEINMTSEEVSATFYEVATPELFVDATSPYCPDQEINIVLSDEGYDYTWYVHTGFSYTEDDIVDVSGTTLTLTFTEQVRVSVEANFEGCTSSTTQYLSAAADLSPFVNFVDYNEQYLCTDSTAELQVPSWAAGDFENFQWYAVEDGVETMIDGATDLIYGTPDIGVYLVKADLLQCPGVQVSSSTIEVESYLDRELYIWATSETLCEGDTAELNISGNDWQNIQWFEETIVIGSTGYEGEFVPMIPSGTDFSQAVTEFNSYMVKARHISCPNGLKIESNAVMIKPTVNPNIVVDPDYGIYNWQVTPWDSAANYIYCTGENVELSLDDDSGDYEWYTSAYGGNPYYEVGNYIEESGNTPIDVIAQGATWYTAKVEIDGCVGYSDPVLIDTYVFSPPAITSYGNGELCEEGDSVLIHNAFPGNYIGFQWFNNGVAVEGATDDSLWVTEPGMYTMTVWREECPDFSMSTGVGPIITMMEAFLVEETDLIWASTNTLGSYTYQWYFNGEPIETPAASPWIFYKSDMADGTYYCEVTNPDGCTKITDEFVWSTIGLKDVSLANIDIFPNPASGHIMIEGVEVEKIDVITFHDITGKAVLQVNPNNNRIEIGELNQGIYLMEVSMTDGNKLSHKLVKD